jgi:secreted PhoX family phosphatase
MSFSRRRFLASASLAAVAIPALRARRAGAQEAPPRLTPDPAGLLDLPESFSYRLISREAEPMDDGLLTPGDFDGMAAFPIEGDASRCVLLRNHELSPDDLAKSGFGPEFERAAGIDPAKVYDFIAPGRPHLGGVSKLIVNLETLEVERRFLALAGASTNCAGGATPWGSWLSCEETEEGPSATSSKPHGFVFEVPSSTDGLVDPVPLADMGRFRHEATAVDPASGVVYLTEDQGDGLFYRFIPNAPGRLAEGGVLQALAIRGAPSADMRNWEPSTPRLPPEGVEVEWITLEDVTAPNADLRLRGRARGAAIFARGEGMALALEADGPAIYFAATSGGPVQLGQIFKYRPSPAEGRDGEAAQPGRLSLFVESDGVERFDMCDNLVASPLGDIVLCEDGDGEQFVRAVRQDGHVYAIARNAHPDQNEFCGACFSPDGRVLFVNVQAPGMTFAITGPWEQLRAA